MLLGDAWFSVTALVLETPVFPLLVGMHWMARFGVDIHIDAEGASIRVAGRAPVRALPTRDAWPVTAARDERDEPAVALTLGVEDRIIDALREHDLAEQQERAHLSPVQPWPLPRLPEVSQIEGEPALRGDDVEAWRLVDVSPDLPANAKADVLAVLEEFADVFGGAGGDEAACIPPLSNLPSAKIELKTTAELDGVRARVRHMSADDIAVIDKFVEDGLRDGLLVDVPDAPCTSAAFVVRVDGKKPRTVVAFDGVNPHFVGNANSVAHLPTIVEHMASSRFERRTTMDLSSSYYAIAMDPASIRFTATLFMTSHGPRVLGFTRMPLGLKMAPGIAQFAFERVFGSDCAWQYIDDSLLGHETAGDVAPAVRRHCEQARAHGLTFKASKCRIGYIELPVLGKLVGPGSIKPLPGSLDALREYPAPATRKALRRFCGLAASLMPHAAGKLMNVIGPLESEKGKRGAFEWTNELNVAFERCKALLMSPEVLTPFDPDRKLLLITDASEQGGAVVFAHMSLDGTHVQIIDVFTHRWTSAEQQYHASQGELMMLRLANERAPHLMVGRTVFLVCDSQIMAQSLNRLNSSTSMRVIRTVIELQHLDIKTILIPGKLNIADAFTRCWEQPTSSKPPPRTLADWATPLVTAAAAVLEAAVRRDVARTLASLAPRVDDEREEGEIDDDDDVAVPDAARADDDDDAVEEIVLSRGVAAVPIAPNPLRPVGAVPAPAPVADDQGEADLQFDLKPLERESRDAWLARWGARQRDDPELSALFVEAEAAAAQRASGAAADSGDVAAEADADRTLTAEIGPDGLLYVKLGGHYRLAVPNGCYTEVLQQMHAGANGAHWSARRTLATSRRWFWWRLQYRHTLDWVKQCVPCQRVKVLDESALLGNSEADGEPKRLSAWQLDTLHHSGQRYLVAVELYSGYVVTCLLPELTSAAMAHALESSVFQSFGVCDVIRCDHGSEFARHLSALCTALGIDLQYGMPHNSRSQSRVERALRTIRQVVAKWQVEGTTEPLHVLVARTAREINCAPSDDQYAISPYEYLFGKSPPVPVIARYLDVDLTGIRATSNQYAVRESLERQAAVHAQLERVRHAQHEERRRKIERDFAHAHRADHEPAVGEWRWCVLPDDAALAAKEKMARRAYGPYVVVKYDKTHGRVDLVLVTDDGSGAQPLRVSVHARRTWPYHKTVSPDDVRLLDATVLPEHWETRAAPLGGLELLPAGVQAKLRAAAKEAARQNALSVQARAKEEAVEKKRRDAERVAAEAALKKAAAERAAEDERLQSEVVECLERQFDKHGAAQVLVRRRNGTKAWLPQSDRMVPAQLLNDLTSKLRQQRIAMRGGGGQRVDTPRVTWATPLVYARREEEL